MGTAHSINAAKFASDGRALKEKFAAAGGSSSGVKVRNTNPRVSLSKTINTALTTTDTELSRQPASKQAFSSRPSNSNINLGSNFNDAAHSQLRGQQ